MSEKRSKKAETLGKGFTIYDVTRFHINLCAQQNPQTRRSPTKAVEILEETSSLIAVLEALASGKPLIASCTDNVPEVIRNGVSNILARALFVLAEKEVID